MVSWADKLAQPQTAAAPAGDTQLANKRIAVVDANAIIAMGTAVRTLGDVIVSTDEVLAEIKDSAAREALAQLSILCRKPSSAALQRVSAFAQQTGDAYTLSLEDVRLLAVAYTLEEELNGTAHLRAAPPPVRSHVKGSAKAAMPGWGTTAQCEEWDAIDAVADHADGVLCSSRVWPSSCAEDKGHLLTRSARCSDRRRLNFVRSSRGCVDVVYQVVLYVGGTETAGARCRCL